MLETLRTPAGDGEVLLLPPSDQLPAMLSAAADCADSMDFEVAGVPAAELRRQARQDLADAIGERLPEPWIATGHQSEMHHAGVWFKDAATVAWAEATGGTAFHIVADLDTVSHPAVVAPRMHSGKLELGRAPVGSPAGNQCPAQLPAPSAESVEAIIELLSQMPTPSDTFAAWAHKARQAAGTGTLAEWITRSRHAANASLGLAPRDVYWSRLIGGCAFARFAADLIVRHEAMFIAHQEALATHRAKYNSHNPTQPVPDLHRGDGATETPLWVFRHGGQREPLYARRTREGVDLLTPAGPMASLPNDPDAAAGAVKTLIDSGVMIAPRALTLTMFLRAFLVDVFIHGTGGARYDLLGDDLTARWFGPGWRPAPFATATATLRLPLDRFDITEADASDARWAAHHAWHNPWAHAAADGGDPPAAAAALRKTKTDALTRLSGADRFSAERAAAFAEIHRANAELRAALSADQQKVANRIDEVESQLANNAIADGREYFFAMMPSGKLDGLIAQARRWAAV